MLNRFIKGVFALVILMLVGCQALKKREDGTFRIVLKSLDDAHTQAYHLYFQVPYIDGYSIPENLKSGLNNSLRWKWLSSNNPPNTCYISKKSNSDEGVVTFDSGLAMLELSKTEISGHLYKFPDAGMVINLDIKEGNVVTGTTEWWGGPYIVIDVDESTSKSEDEDISSEQRKVRFQGKLENINSINECFAHISEVLSKQER